MVESFAIVVIVVAVGFAIVGVVTLAGARRSYDDIGHGPLSLRDGGDLPPDGPGTVGTRSQVRDAEIRQLLEARNARRARRAEPPLDVEAELARLTAAPPAVADPALRAEIRSLVEASNARRVRRGDAPLDVEAEVERRLGEL